MNKYQLETLYTELIKLKKDFRNNKINHEDTIVYLNETGIDLVVDESKKGEKL